jgi:hypothetical protein
MSTRMQQRRGTASQWISTNSGNGPILAAGEIGFESDTNKFKIGDGVNHWVDLTYFTDAEGAITAISDLIDGAPDALNTLNELAAALGDDPNFLASLPTTTVMNQAIVTHKNTTTDIHGISDTAALATKTYADGKASSAQTDAEETAATALSNHATDTTNIHGIADTSALATLTDADTAASNAINTHNSDTTSVHGIADTALLATKTYADGKASDAQTAATDAASTALSAHETDTSNVHGITDTSLLVTTTGTQSLSNKTLASPTIEIGGTTVSATEISYLDGVTSNIQTQISAKATSSDISSAVSTHSSDTTSVHGITDTSKLVTTDASTQTLDGDLVVSGNLTIEGTTTTVNATDLVVTDPLIYIGEGNSANLVDLGLVSSFNDGTYQHSGIVRDASAGKWKVFKGVTDEPTTTINFAQGSLDDLAANNVEVAGVVFTDGTQSKEGVPSRTPIIQKTASYTLSALTERDSLIEVASSSGTTITIPTNSSVAYPVGTSLDILQTSTGQVTIAGAGGVTVNATPGLKLRTQWSSATLFKRAENTWVVYGDLTA